MSKLKIKTAAFYRVQLPKNPTELSGHLEKIAHEELKATQGSGSGFVNVPTHGELVAEFPGGYAFTLQVDEKIVPASVVKSEVAKWGAEFEKNAGYKPGRIFLKEAKEVILTGLLSRALIRTTLVTAFYHKESETLILPVGSKTLRNTFMAQLVRAVDSLKTTTIYVSEAKGSLTNRLSSFMAGEINCFDTFDLGSKVVMDSENGKLSFDVSDIKANEQGITEAISAGYRVKEIALARDSVLFRLDQDFIIKGITFGDDAIPEQEEEEDDEESRQFEHEAGAQVAIIVGILDSLCNMFGYQSPEEAKE